MFTGIVQGMARIAEITDLDHARRLVLDLPAGRGEGLQIGASVSVSGVCLTAVHIDGDRVAFDVIAESLDRTTLGERQVGDAVNIERAARYGDEIGGHLLSGHIWGVAEVTEVQRTETNCSLRLRAPDSAVPYLIAKGYIGIDGASLTLGEVDAHAGTFELHLIPETLRITTLGQATPGTRINLELDAMTQAVVTTVQRVLERRP